MCLRRCKCYSFCRRSRERAHQPKSTQKLRDLIDLILVTSLVPHSVAKILWSGTVRQVSGWRTRELRLCKSVSICFQLLPAFQKPRGFHSHPNVEIRTFTRVILIFIKSVLLTHGTPGTRQAFLPGGYRTGAPGKHVVRGKAKYRLCDEKVRYFVAPPIEDIRNSPVRPTCVDPALHTETVVSFAHMLTSGFD